MFGGGWLPLSPAGVINRHKKHKKTSYLVPGAGWGDATVVGERSAWLSKSIERTFFEAASAEFFLLWLECGAGLQPLRWGGVALPSPLRLWLLVRNLKSSEGKRMSS
jgi:hypothetical protein